MAQKVERVEMLGIDRELFNRTHGPGCQRIGRVFGDLEMRQPENEARNQRLGAKSRPRPASASSAVRVP